MAEEAAGMGELAGGQRFDALYQSAVLVIMMRDFPRAEQKLRAAIEAAPTWYRPRMALASVLWWQGQDRQAETEAGSALRCAGPLQPYVKRTLDGARAQAHVIGMRIAAQ